MPTTPEDNLDEYLRECLRIEPLALQEEFVRTPADFAYWNEQYKQALEKYMNAKAERERVFAKVYLISCEKPMPNGKQATVDYAKALVEGDPEYRNVYQDEITAEVEVAKLKGVLEAIRTKRDMLIQIGAQVRQELQHDPLVRAAAENKRYG